MAVSLVLIRVVDMLNLIIVQNPAYLHDEECFKVSIAVWVANSPSVLLFSLLQYM